MKPPDQSGRSTESGTTRMDLWQDFQTNQGKTIHKWEHYFPVYERHFAPWRGRSVTFLEIGVSRGGSLQMWRRYFGPLARVVGIDIDKRCKAHEESRESSFASAISRTRRSCNP
jgi:hypothetical protein